MNNTTPGASVSVDLLVDGIATDLRPSSAPATPLGEWFREGLRASVFLRPRVPAAEPSAAQFLAMLVAATGFYLLAGRVVIPGAAEFSLRNWLATWWTIALMVLVAWTLFRMQRRTDGGQASVAAWYGLWSVALLPLIAVHGLYELAWYHDWLSPGLKESQVLAWSVAATVWIWHAGLAARIAAAQGLPRARQALLALAIAALSALNAVQFSNARPWYPAFDRDDEPERQGLVLSQEVFENQQAVWNQAVRQLSPQRKGVRDVYGIVFAPYGSEDVFKRESTLAADVLRERFDAKGRVLQLLNHSDTTRTLPWATPENLRRAIKAVGARMDRQQDVLVVYLTSHGASNFALAAEHYPLTVPRLTPRDLRRALDEAGIRNRVIAISACYSGGWIEPLAGDSTLVMTAADATHTSYGCGYKSELTYFGRALWDEQLRHTHSFEEAFAAAVPVIRQREIDGRKADGFSNPQIRVGAAIRPVLAEIEKRLDRAAPH